MAGVLVRKAVYNDAAGIAKVKVDTWRSAYRGIIPDDYLAGMSYDENLKRFRNALADDSEKEYFFIAEKDGEVIGFTVCGYERSGDKAYTGEVYAIYVLEACQRTGVGRMLMKAAAGRLAELGLCSMLLWTPAGSPYCLFYERLGGSRLSGKKSEIGPYMIDLISYGWSDTGPLL